MPARRVSLTAGLLAVLAYVAIGIATADFALASSGRSRTLWRLAAWVLSFVVFVVHVGYERVRLRSSAGRTARQATYAVAAAAFALALVGPAASHWGEPGFSRTAVLSLLLWPVLAGIPAFGAAMVITVVLARVLRAHDGAGAGRPAVADSR